MSADGLRVQRVTTTEGFAALRGEWDGLLRESRADGLFLTWEWLFTWWQTFADDRRELYILTVCDGRGRLVGLAPLHVRGRRDGGRLGIRTLMMLGTGEPEADEVCSDYLGFLARRGMERAVAGALWGALAAARRDWDAVLLRGLVADCACTSALAEAAAAAGCAARLEPAGQSLFVPLDGPWEQVLGRAGADLRRKVRRGREALARAGTWKYVGVEGRSEVAAALAALAALHTARWRARGKPGVFASERFRRFHAAFAPLALERGWLHLQILTLEGRPVAALYNFRYGKRMYYYQSGFDIERAGRLSPGHLMHSLCIEESIALGLAEYDFLLGGQASYRRWWGCRQRPVQSLVVEPGGVKGLASHLEGLLGRGARALRRRLLPRAAAGALSAGPGGRVHAERTNV